MIYEDTIVRLRPGELLFAAGQAAHRWSQVNGREARDRGNVDDVGLDRAVAGLCGEIAAARWTGRYWTAEEGRGAGDVGGLEVRTRRGDPRDETLELILQPYDEQHRPDHPFMLVIGRAAHYRIVGWTSPRHARRQHQLGSPYFRQDDPGRRGRPCLLVAQSVLFPPDEFKVESVQRRLDEDAA